MSQTKTIDAAFANKQKKLTFKQKLAQRLVLRHLNKLQKGCLTIEFNNKVSEFGEASQTASITAHIRVNNAAAFQKFIANANVGAGQAYIDGDWDSPDLLSVIRVFCLNMNIMNNMKPNPLSLTRIAAKLLQQMTRNTLAGSRRNISAHYDLSNDFFSQFLDPTMMYSSAIFPNRASSLETASNEKLRSICEQLQLNENDHLLEIGTGWGGMAVYAAKHYGCKVTTTTISQEQYNYTKKRIEQEGLTDQITLLLDDYRDLDGQFDKLVSIEMIEAVGREYYQAYFRACSNLLKPDGLMLIQAITMSDQRYHEAARSVDFIKRYIFPGGCLPSNEIVAKHVAQDTDMQITSIKDITAHYADTLASWRENFKDKLHNIKELGFDDSFIRMWDYYFVYCEGGFRERVISTVHYLFAKPDYRPH